MRTYQKRASWPVMSSLRRYSLLVPCQGPRQGKELPCHAVRISSQAIDSNWLVCRRTKIFPLFPCRQGKSRPTRTVRIPRRVRSAAGGDRVRAFDAGGEGGGQKAV